MRPALFLLFLSLLVAWPQLCFEQWREHEAVQQQIAAEVVQSGDWMVPTLGGDPTLRPPLCHWILAGLRQVSTDPMVARLPSILGFWLLAVVAYRALRRRSSRLAATVSSVGILLSPLVLSYLALAEIEPVFAALTGISIMWLSEGAVFGNRRQLVWAGVCGGLAAWAAGASFLVFLAGTGLVWMRRLRFAGFAWFAVPAIVVVMAYYVPLVLWHVEAAMLGDRVSSVTAAVVSGWGWAAVVDTPFYFVRAILALLPLGVWTFHEYRGDREMREAVLGQDEAFLRMSAGAMVGTVLLLVWLPERPWSYFLPAVPCYILALGPAIAAYMRFGAAPSLMLGRFVYVFAGVGCVGLALTPWMPHPFDRGTPWFCLALAIAPLIVRIRRDLVLYALAVPLIAAWTLIPDVAEWRAASHESERIGGVTLAREVQRFGADDLTTRGDVPPAVVLAMPELPASDPHKRRPPTSQWLLAPAADLDELPASYAERVRVQLGARILVLLERR